MLDLDIVIDEIDLGLKVGDRNQIKDTMNLYKFTQYKKDEINLILRDYKEGYMTKEGAEKGSNEKGERTLTVDDLIRVVEEIKRYLLTDRNCNGVGGKDDIYGYVKYKMEILDSILQEFDVNSLVSVAEGNNV